MTQPTVDRRDSNPWQLFAFPNRKSSEVPPRQDGSEQRELAGLEEVLLEDLQRHRRGRQRIPQRQGVQEISHLLRHSGDFLSLNYPYFSLFMPRWLNSFQKLKLIFFPSNLFWVSRHFYYVGCREKRIGIHHLESGTPGPRYNLWHFDWQEQISSEHLG